MTIFTFLAVLVLLVGVPLNWYVARRATVLDKESPNAIIRDRVGTAWWTLILAFVFGFVFLSNDIWHVLDPDATKLITRLTVLAVVFVPAVRWIRLYRQTEQVAAVAQESALQRIEEKLDDTAKTIEIIDDTHAKVVDIHDALPGSHSPLDRHGDDPA